MLTLDEAPSPSTHESRAKTGQVWQWLWSFDAVQYYRDPGLSSAELLELAVFVAHRQAGLRAWRKTTYERFERLLLPLNEVLNFSGADAYNRLRVLNILLTEMQLRQSSFWAWSEAEWSDLLNTHITRIHLKMKEKVQEGGIPLNLLAVAYLLGGFRSFYELKVFFRKTALARKVFGNGPIDTALQRLEEGAAQMGYGHSRPRSVFPMAICEAFLLNANPYLENLHIELLETVRQHSFAHLKEDCYAISRILENMGIFSKALPPFPPKERTLQKLHTEDDVPAEWLKWCQRWYETTTLSPGARHHYYYALLKAGRWLAQQHPQALSPEDWNREMAAEYVATVDRMLIGQWSHLGVRAELQGKPLCAKSKHRELCALRTFFRDGQEWEWFKVRFDPQRCFATPRNIRARIAPNPRIIEDDLWAKLLWAGLNLTIDDLPKGRLGQLDSSKSVHYYPLELVRAMVIIWLFAGLRSDEIYRLRIGCIRWQAGKGQVEDVAISEADVISVHKGICLLDVPVNKTSTAFTKPVDRVVGEAIEAWEKVRPVQKALLDSKTGEMVHFLFAYRGKYIGRNYLNRRIIKLLCQKAGIPERDRLGNITSHRARSTIASQLFNAREPMSLFELQQWLGHSSPASTQYYAKISPTKLTKAYTEAGYFEHNVRSIKVLIDQEALKKGAATHGEEWKFYDLGHGYCTYDFFDQCPHRMACAKCAFYRPKGSSQAQMLEAKTNLLRLRQDIPLSQEEQAAVDDGLKALERLCEQLADMPTPAGPTPRELQLAGKRFLPVLNE